MTDFADGRQPDQASFLASLPGWLTDALPGFLPRQRWFGDKARQIAATVVTEIIPINEIGKPAALVFVDVHFSSGYPAQYVLPVVFSATPPDAPPSRIANVQFGHLIDGLSDSAVRSWLMRTIAGGAKPDPGSLVADRPSTASDTLAACQAGGSRLLGAEQSNTSILYGSHALVKVFRRLQPGVNPDVELSRFLTAKTRFEHVPHYLGSISHRSPDRISSVIAFAQSFVENAGDGWTFLLQTINDHLADTSGGELLTRSREIARQLGEVTALLHLALASDSWTTEMAPEPIKRGDAERWAAEYLDLIERVISALEEWFDRLDARTRELATLFIDGAPGLRKREAGFYRLIGRSKTRVHGDYHLGQTLRTTSGGFVVIDFEGEPQRTIEERRRKTSPLKDVAGMLRSFSYARGTATAWLEDSTSLLQSDLVAWEREMRRAFLAAYADTARAGSETFLPASNEDFQEALAAWELDKAAYEVLYEINNRPDWLWIPLSGMVKQSEPDV